MAGGTTLEYTPTWIVAIVCTIMVVISLAVERILHFTGKYLMKKNQKPLYQALQKIKEELMLLGFISLLLTVFQYRIVKICISEELGSSWLPCDKNKKKQDKTSSSDYDYCPEGKVPLLSVTALHHLHTFIFVLAVAHVTFSVLTMLFAGLKIRQWKHWEDSISKKDSMTPEEVFGPKFTHVQDHDFIKNRFKGIGKKIVFFSWMRSFFKQFYASVTKADYLTLRLGFIMTHCKGNPKFNFHKYMIRALEADFKKVVGISWYLWAFVVVFLLLNVSGWNAYFWIAFIPLILLLAVGTKLEHVITQLAQEVAEKHVAIEGDLVVTPSDDHFWFHNPRLVLFLIHIILFQNSFELAFFFWIFAEYGFDSCIMGKVGYIIPRLVIGVFVQFVCSYSTFPLYAIVTQMGSMYKKAIFEEHIQEGLAGWAKLAKKKNKLGNSGTKMNKDSSSGANSNQVAVSPSASPSTSLLELHNISASPEIVPQAHTSK